MSDFIKEIESELLSVNAEAFRKGMINERNASWEIWSKLNILECYAEEMIQSDPKLVHDELFENDMVDSLPESEIRDKLRNIQHAIENYFRVA